jgi:succinate dehydrogenase / fumarate reductase membrane anchor subunit
MTTISKTGGRVAPQGNQAATFWWRFMRLSGILVIPLVFGHLAIVHLINSVAVINYEWVVTQRWSILPWRIYDAALLWLAGIHGFRGLKYVINDYIHNQTWNRVLTAAILLLALFVLAVGSIALIGTPYSLD